MKEIKRLAFADEDADGNNPVQQWLLDREDSNKKDRHIAKVTAWLLHMKRERKIPSGLKPVKGKEPHFSELSNGRGGTRLYLHVSDNGANVLVLGAGTKDTQTKDIEVSRKRLKKKLEDNPDEREK